MMTEETQQGTMTGFGARLKKARETMHLSEKDAAARLHLNPNIIQILESESFNDAPPATFMRGYLKSYARLLNFNEQEVSNALESLGLNIQPTCATVSPLLNTNNLYKSDRYIHWITYLVVGVLVVMVGFWWNSHSRSSLQNTLVHNILTQQTTDTKPANPQPATATTVATAAQASVPAAAPAPVAAAPQKPAPITIKAAPATVTPVSPAPIATPATAQNTQNTTPAAIPPAVTLPAPAVSQNATPAAPQATVPLRAPQPTTPGAAPFATATPDALANDNTAKHQSHDDDDDENGVAMAVPEPGLEPN